MKIIKEFVACTAKDYYQGMCKGPTGNIFENYHKSIQLVERSYDTWTKLSHVPLTAATNRDMGVGYSEVTGHFYTGDPWTQGAVEYTVDGQTKVRSWMATGNITGIHCHGNLLYACSNYSKFIKVWDIAHGQPRIVRDITVGYIQGGCAVLGDKLWVSELGKHGGHIHECDLNGKKTGKSFLLPENRRPWSIVVGPDNHLWVRTNWHRGSVKVYCIELEEASVPAPVPTPDEPEDEIDYDGLIKQIIKFLKSIF